MTMFSQRENEKKKERERERLKRRKECLRYLLDNIKHKTSASQEYQKEMSVREGQWTYLKK